ncbi:MAG: response regulator [Chloroflexota bacterium]
MSPANVLNLQQEGIAAARAGNKPTAHRLLLEASKNDPKNKSIWLWLAVVAPSAAESVSYLREALALSPGNAQIAAALQQAEKRLEREQTAVWHCPICETAASTAQETCPSCRAVVSLSNQEALFNNPSPNSEKLLAAMTRLQQRLEKQPNDVATRYKLALAHLNLGELAIGLEQLRAALVQQPDNSLIKTAVSTIEARLPKEPAPETVPAEETPVAPAWICPLCLTGAEAPADPCTTCGAILTLTDVKSVLENAGANRELLETAVQRLQEENRRETAVSTHYKLALAQLNLGQIDIGIDQLNAGLKLQSDNRAIRALVTVLLQHKAAEEAAKAKAALPDKNKDVIMIVDDSPTIRKLVSMTLEEAGYGVVSAADGMQALGKLNGHSPDLNGRLPDLILLDITMPRMDGYQVCKIIKGYKQTKGIPVVMLSGKDGFFDKVRGRIAGSTDYITKPFQPKELVQAVNKHTKRGRN